MITTEEDRESTLFQRGSRQAGYVAADTRYGAKIPGTTLRTTLSVFAKRDSHVTKVVDLVSEPLQPLTEVGIADGERTHIHAAS